jgi:uncharacterized protein
MGGYVAEPRDDIAALEVETALRHHLVRVYSLMVAGLLLTAAIAFWISRTPQMLEYIGAHPAGFQILFAFEVVTAAVVSKSVDKLSLPMVAIVFFFYAALNGVTFAVFSLWMPTASIALAFAVAALTFGAMAVYGSYTKRDLGSLPSFLTMIAIGVGLLSLVNLAFGNPREYWATSYLGVMVFAGLTAFHAQDLRDLEFEFEDDDEDHCKAMYAGALVLYLDFVNLYLMLARLVGATRKPS